MEVETNGCDEENRRKTSEERKISGDKKKLKLSKRHETGGATDQERELN